MHKIAVIGSGFSGLSAAAYLSAAGNDVHVYEKNSTSGGRARQLKTHSGYVFDMGPSWYWMPDVFAKFFNDFGYYPSDFYELKLLDPSFEVVFESGNTIKVPQGFEELRILFESIEPGSGARLMAFMEEAEFKYKTGMENFVYKPGLSISEFSERKIIGSVFRLQVFSSFSKHIRKYFSNPKLVALMEFPVLFLGAMPQETPAMYSLMNYAGLKLGTWYPLGGFGKVSEAMENLAKSNGTVFHYNSGVTNIEINNESATHIVVNGERIPVDAVLATADYHHVESKLLPAKYRNYEEKYWQKKTMAPSSLIFYLGLNKRISSIQHHTLFFEHDLLQHSKEIYKTPRWPSEPLFYVCCPSQSDNTVAPPGHENLFLLMPIAAGLNDTDELREKYFKLMIARLEIHVKENITSHIDFKESYCVNDFVSDYNSYRGNAYGLANTLSQTALFKPKIRNKKIKNLFYAGQLTVPGPGVPPSLISGKIASKQLLLHLNRIDHEVTV